MIYSDCEYTECVRRVKEARLRLAQCREKLAEMKLSPEEIQRALDPMESFYLGLAEEIKAYDGEDYEEEDHVDWAKQPDSSAVQKIYKCPTCTKIYCTPVDQQATCPDCRPRCEICSSPMESFSFLADDGTGERRRYGVYCAKCGVCHNR